MGFSQAERASPLALQAGESAALTNSRFQALPPDRHPGLREIAGAAMAREQKPDFAPAWTRSSPA